MKPGRVLLLVAVAAALGAASAAAETWKEAREAVVDLRSQASPESALVALDAVAAKLTESHPALGRERGDLRDLLQRMTKDEALRTAVHRVVSIGQ